MIILLILEWNLLGGTIGKMRKNLNGFTLIELMVVIVIIGILAAIAVPSYNKYVVNAKISEAYTLMDAIGKKQLTYHSENKEFYNLNQPNPQNLDTKTIFAHPNWEDFNYPIAVGVGVYFVYRAWAGKIDSGGNELVNVGDSISGYGFTQLSNASIIMARHQDGTACNAASLTATDAGIASENGLDWSIVVAVADMDNDYGSSCTALVRVLESSSATQNNPAYSGGFLAINSGE